MKILFIYTNINGFHEDTYAIGLASIISVVKMKGHSIKAAVVHSKNDYSKIFGEIEQFNPRVIGFTSVSSQFGYVKELAASIKAKHPNIIIVCGGVHPTINPQCILESNHLDAIFVGESEMSFVEFLERVGENRPYDAVDNIAYVKDGKLKSNKLKPLINDLDALPYPDKEIYPYEETIKAVGYAPFLFSRGCPYLCAYCSNHALANAYGLPRNNPRYRSAENSISEIEEAVKRFPIQTILICDDIFGLNKEWRLEFCKQYKKKIRIKFQCLLRPNLIDDDLVRLLREAGCYRVTIGIESGNDYVRNVIMNRQITDQQIIKAFGLAHKYGLETNALNIIGVPGETENMIWDTVNICRKIKPTSCGVNIFYPYKGTRLGDDCFEKGLVDEELYASFSNERRRTVMKYPEPYKRKLSYYRENWDSLVYPFNLKRRLVDLIKRTFIWSHLRRMKRNIFYAINRQRLLNEPNG